jgi:hypothetical protein
METRQDVESVHPRHLHVQEHEVRRFAFDEREPLLAVVLERHPQRFADAGVVVYYENAWLRHERETDAPQRPSTRIVNKRR